MRFLFNLRSLPSVWPLAVALFLAASLVHAEDTELFFINVDEVTVKKAPADPAAPQPAPAAAPTPAPAKDVKPANTAPRVKETSRVVKPATARISLLDRPIVYPNIFPNPLAFNMTWTVTTNRKLAQLRSLVLSRRIAADRAAMVRRRAPLDPAAQKAVEQQIRRILEPMLKVEISFASRAADLKPDDRKKLAAAANEWFDKKFITDFVKNLDPNQQQMWLQGMQLVGWGNGQQKTENPREAVRVAIAQVVKDTLAKEQVAAYAEECRKRDEFQRQVSADNLVERIDDKVKLSPDQWKRIAQALTDHWDKSRDSQLEAFAQYGSMWPGVPEQWVSPELTPAQQAVLTRINSNAGQMWISVGVGGIFNQMFGGNVEAFDDADAAAAGAEQPAAAMPEKQDE